MAFSYRNTYTNPANQTNYTFSACDLGTPGTNRLVVVAVLTGSSNPSAVTVDGTSATLVVESNAGDGAAEIWQAETTANATGDIVVTVAAATRCVIHVWAGYPSSATAVDSTSAEATATTVVLSDLAKTDQGFTVLFGLKNTTIGTAVTWVVTQNGAETVVENNDAVVESPVTSVAASHDNTATTTTDDYTFTASASESLRAAGASWGPEAAGDMVGATTVAFSASGVLTGSGALSGTSSTAFSTTGAMLATAGISGVATLTFTLSGTLDPIPDYVWPNPDGLIIVYGTQEGATFPPIISLPDFQDYPGKLRYDKPNPFKFRRMR